MEYTGKTTNTQKRKPKGDIKYNIDLNEEQKNAKRLILENDITVLKGQAGSGKTLLACLIACIDLSIGDQFLCFYIVLNWFINPI
jgi:predicted ribonuclease YlaK